MATAVLKADQAVIDILSMSEIDETGLTLKGQLDRKQYESVNKFLEVAGAKWNRSAKRHIFLPGAKTKIEELISSAQIVDEKKQFQAFYTPQAIAEELVAIAGVGKGTVCLEPSAGIGSIALAAKNVGGEVYCVELNADSCKKLKEHGFNVLEGDFLEVKPENTSAWAVILMNPPFANDQDIKHVMHAYKMLLPGGRLLAIMSSGFQWSKGRKIRSQFQDFVAENGRIVKKLPSGAFSESGTQIRTVIVELQRTSSSEDRLKASTTPNTFNN